MTDFIERYRRTGQAPTLAEKLETARSLDELDGMTEAAKDRMTADDMAAAARRRAELQLRT